MALATVHTRAQLGINAPEVHVEAHLAGGLPALSIVGLPEAAVRESKERVRSALQNCQFEYPARRITINLAPADLPKEGGRYDLAIAIGILAASGQVDARALQGLELYGELSLGGALRQTPGLLAAVLAATRRGVAVVVPRANASEAALVPDARVYVADNLLEVCAHLSGMAPLQKATPAAPQAEQPGPDLREVRGQHQARRALEIAAAGGHNLLFTGPPGAGKSMLAMRMPGLLPPLCAEDALEVAAIQSLTGTPVTHWPSRPFRAPHHTASAVALVGGGSNPRPGEISLAHHGVLFLDELPEFPSRVLEVLRAPLETGEIAISRARQHIHFPARFQLIAAMNPCPCGHSGEPDGRCRCTPDQARRYRNRVSGPLLDRIDLHIQVRPLNAAALAKPQEAETSAAVRARVIAARDRQLQRRGHPNAHLSVTELEQDAALSSGDRNKFAQTATQMGLSARGFHRVLKVARTVADLAGQEAIGPTHLLEAIGYRGLDRTAQ